MGNFQEDKKILGNMLLKLGTALINDRFSYGDCNLTISKNVEIYGERLVDQGIGVFRLELEGCRGSFFAEENPCDIINRVRVACQRSCAGSGPRTKERQLAEGILFNIIGPHPADVGG